MNNGTRDSYWELFKDTKILSMYSQCIYSLILHTLNNKHLYNMNNKIHKYRYNNNLHLPIINLPNLIQEHISQE